MATGAKTTVMPNLAETREEYSKTPPAEPSIEFAGICKSDIQAESETDELEEPTKDAPNQIADRRNKDRICTAVAIDQQLLRKSYLPNIEAFFPFVCPGPDDSATPPGWLMKAIAEVAATTVLTPRAPPIRFDLSDASVRHNSQLLKECDLDLGKFLAAHQDTTLRFGSEFRPIEELKKILAGFSISPLPSEISSFVIRALQTLESSLTQSKNQPTRRKTESGDDGPRSVQRPASTLTLSSLSYSSTIPNSSCDPFCPSTEWLNGAQQAPLLASVRAPWFRQLCAMPQATWLRRSGVVSNGAPFTSKEAPIYSPPSGPS